MRVLDDRHLHAGLRARRTRLVAARMVGLGARARVLRLLLLLEPPARARERGLLGGARRASPEPVLQPLDGTAPDQQRRAFWLDVLLADGCRGRAARDVRRRGDRRPALPVLDPHRSGRQARLVRSLVRVAVEPPRASRGQRPLHRPQLRRHLHGLGPPLRHVRRGSRALRLRHAHAAQFVGPAVGEPRGLRRPRAQIPAVRALGRSRARLVQAAGLAARRGSTDGAASKTSFDLAQVRTLRPAADRRRKAVRGDAHPAAILGSVALLWYAEIAAAAANVRSGRSGDRGAVVDRRRDAGTARRDARTRARTHPDGGAAFDGAGRRGAVHSRSWTMRVCSVPSWQRAPTFSQNSRSTGCT